MSGNIVCFGEILWDILPTEKIAGGAPMNVAIRLQSLGVNTKIISKIGIDKSGNDLVTIFKNKNVDTSLLQIDETVATGEVLVNLDEKGNATYDIVYPSAWDKIMLTEASKNAVEKADAFVFGSLACRDKVSRTTLLELLKVAKYKVFDVNIRPPFYTLALLEELMLLANVIKLNDDELKEIAQSLGSKTNEIEANILYLSKRTNTSTICVTKGKDGAVLYIDNQFYYHKGFSVRVTDTIGAGDSFLAALLSKIIYTNDYKKAIAYGCAVGALVASHKGANPEISHEEIVKFLND